MRKFGWTLPIAGLAISLGGLLVEVLSGQSVPFATRGERGSVELLAPEFELESTAVVPFQTPALEVRAAKATQPTPPHRPVIEPRNFNDSATVAWPIVVPGPKLNPVDLPIEPEFTPPEPPEPQQSTMEPSEPEWMKSAPSPIAETSPDPVLSATGTQSPVDLPPLPLVPLQGFGHSQTTISDLPRPGHSSPKRLCDFATGLRTR